MSLWFDLMVNHEFIGRMAIQRKAPLGKIGDDDIGVYDITVDGKFTGRLEHRYEDGAWVLARKALEKFTGDSP